MTMRGVKDVHYLSIRVPLTWSKGKAKMVIERTFDSQPHSPMTTRLSTSRHSESKLQNILAHSAQIFAERGFEGASIRDISRATGVSLSGLYYYFESKQKLLYLIQKNAFDSILQSLQERLPAAESSEERLRILIENHVAYFLAHPAEMKVLSHEEDSLGEPYRKEIAAIKRRYYNFALDIFQALAMRRSGPELNPRVAVLSLYGMMNWIYKWHNAKDPGARELAEIMAGIFSHGVAGTAVESAGSKTIAGLAAVEAAANFRDDVAPASPLAVEEVSAPD